MQKQFENACLSEDIDEINRLLDKSNDLKENSRYENLQKDHTEIVKLMIEKGTNNWNVDDFNIETDHFGIIKHLIENGATSFIDLTEDEIIHLLKLGVNINKFKWYTPYDSLLCKITNHKQETSKYLPLPKELITLVNQYQLF